MAAAIAKVCSENTHRNECSVCGAPARRNYCSGACRQKAFRTNHPGSDTRKGDRHKNRQHVDKPTVHLMSDEEITAHVASYLNDRRREIQTASPRGAPGPWIHSSFVENKRESRARLRAKVNVSSRPQVASALKPWTDGFLPETKDQFLREKRALLLKEREAGVPVDMGQESDEVKEYHQKRNEKKFLEDICR